jgi:hypothetical protein
MASRLARTQLVAMRRSYATEQQYEFIKTSTPKEGVGLGIFDPTTSLACKLTDLVSC